MATKDPLESVLAEFAARIRDVVKKEVIESFLGGAALTPKKRGRRSSAAPTNAPERKKGAKRDPADLDALVGKLAAVIKSRPGQRIEQIAKGFDVGSKDLALPVKKLLASKAITKKGTRRATTYFPGT